MLCSSARLPAHVVETQSNNDGWQVEATAETKLARMFACREDGAPSAHRVIEAMRLQMRAYQCPSKESGVDKSEVD